MPSLTDLKVAFVGIRHPHIFVRAEFMSNTAGVDPVGFYEEDIEIATRFAAETQLRRFATLEELLATAPDLVIIEALDTQVPVLAMAAAAHTRALLLEKPGAPDRASMDALVAALSDKSVEVEVGYQLHYSESVEYCREILASGALGQITMARFHAGCPIGCGAELWQSVPGDLGGVVFTEGCHILELMVDTIGMPERVFGAVQRLPRGALVRSDVVKPDLFAGTGEVTELYVGDLMYEDIGAAIFYYADKIATLEITAWEASDWVAGWRMEYFGTNGTLSVTPNNPPTIQLYLRTPYGKYQAGNLTLQSSGALGRESSLKLDATYERQMNKLLSNLREQRPPSQESLRTAQKVIHLLDAIYTSAKAAKLVELF